MNQIMPFSFEGNQVRMVIVNGEPRFVAADACAILGIDTSVSVNGQWRLVDGEYVRSGGLDDDEKATHIVSTPGGPQEMIVVTEAGLYSLILKSRKPEAKAFKRWLTHEVLPQIRKTGRYEIQGRRLPGNYVEALEDLLATERARLEAEKQLALQAPKVAVYEAALSAKNSLTMEQVAKAIGWGRNSLFRELKSRGILLSNNLPYQNHIDCGRFVVRVTPITIGGQSVDKTQTLVTPKGLDYLSRLLGDDRRRSA